VTCHPGALLLCCFSRSPRPPSATLFPYTTLFRSYDLSRLPPEKWVNNPKDCWEIADRITAARHYEIVTAAEAKTLRHRDEVEVRSDQVTVFPIPKWKRRRL